MPFGINLDRNRPRNMVFYGRVSTEHEAQLDAFENQIQWYDDIALRHPNWAVLEKYLDRGITGTQAKKRPAFQRMLGDARQGKFDLIVTREVCRFARNTVDTLVDTRELKNLGVEVYFVEDNIWTMDGDGELRLTLMATLAQDESRKISERVKAGQKISRDNGVLYGTGNIIGYDRVDGNYVINPEQAETVRMIFDLYLKGYGIKKLVTELSKAKRKDGYGKVSWSCSKISRILRNTSYKGYQTYHQSYSNNYLEQKRVKNFDESTRILMKGNFEPIVSEEVWDSCDALRRSRSTTVMKNGKPQNYGKPSPKDVWTPRMRCKCGSTFHRCKWRANKRGDEAFGYQCYNQYNNGSKAFREKNGLSTEGYCDVRMVGDWKLELMARKILEGIWSDRKQAVLDAYNMVSENIRSDKADNRAAVSALDGKINRLKVKIEGFITMRAEGELSKEEYRTMKAKADEELTVLLTEREAVSRPSEETAYKPDMEAIRQALEESIDFSQPFLSRDVINKFVQKITTLDNRRFQWDMNFMLKNTQPIFATVDGRKTSPSVTVEGEEGDALPNTYFFSFHYEETVTISHNTNSSGELPRRLYARGRCRLYFEFVIDFETAKAFRKANDSFLRANQWQDITVEVYI